MKQGEQADGGNDVFLLGSCLPPQKVLALARLSVELKRQRAEKNIAAEAEHRREEHEKLLAALAEEAIKHLKEIRRNKGEGLPILPIDTYE